MEDEFTTIRVSKETKEEIDRQKISPMGEVTTDDFIKYLLKNNKKK